MDKIGMIRGQSEQLIRRRLLQAIFEQRMPPGARLTEESLAETFDVSRTVIRQVIARLAQDGILVKGRRRRHARSRALQDGGAADSCRARNDRA